MVILTQMFMMLVIGSVVGTATGLLIRFIDRRKKITRVIDLKDGITLQYDYSQPGIYERLRELLAVE
jgi:hypothetical protein